MKNALLGNLMKATSSDQKNILGLKKEEPKPDGKIMSAFMKMNKSQSIK